MVFGLDENLHQFFLIREGGAAAQRSSSSRMTLSIITFAGGGHGRCPLDGKVQEKTKTCGSSSNAN